MGMLTEALRVANAEAKPHERRNALRKLYGGCPVKFSDEDLDVIVDVTMATVDNIAQHAAETLDRMERLLPPNDGIMHLAAVPLAAMLAGKQVEVLGESLREAVARQALEGLVESLTKGR